MRYLLIFLLWFVSVFGLGFVIESEEKAYQEVTKFVEWYHQNLPNKMRRKALSLIPYIVEYSEQYEIDPLLTSTIIALESSFRPYVTGQIGERGLMQVHWRGAKKGFDMTNPGDQIHAGVKHLRYCFDKCGTLERALTAYATGGCNKNFKMLRYRIRYYHKAIARFRQ